MEKLKPPTDMPVEEIKGKILGVEESVEKCLKDSRGVKMEIDALLDEGVGFERSLEEKEKSKLQAEERVKTVEESLDKLIEAKDKCPVCGKDLDEKHKREKIHEYEQEIRRNDELSNRIAAEIEDLKKTIEEVEEEVEQRVSDVVREFREEKETLEKIRDELQVFNEKIREKRRLEGEFAKSKEKESRMTKELLEVEGRIEELTKQLEKLRDVEEKRVEIEGRIEGTVRRLRETERELAAREADRENLKRRLEEIQREIEEMESAKRFWSKLGAHAEWIGGFLTPLTATIERHFMLELRRQFDPVFREWFKLLIDDETLSVRLADDFSPVIDQQGYEAEYENLSGGESTSVALAYRLALNKVINTMVEEIRTRDLIILDEPTDGFSDEQLDKIRDIIEELNMPQTIIVSHEPKVESYVDNIIRIYKDDGVSRIERG